METELCAVAPSDWQIKSVDDVCVRVTSGGTPSRREPSYYTGGTWPWVKTQELQDKWIDDTEEHITDEAVASSSAKVLPARTVLVAMYGATVGQLGILRRPMTCNQACSALVVDPWAADYRYLYFQLLHIRSQLKALATGAAQQNLSGVLIKSLRFPFPLLPEQRAIAHILGTLDDKIELNRKQNETLEAMARALFKAWFVDFEPVRAKMEGRWQRGQSLPGLPAHLYDLFPDRLVESELGEIPEGWEMRSLDSIANYLNGLALQKFPPESDDEFLPVIKIAQLRAGNTNGADRASARIKPEYVVVDGDVLFSWSGSLEVEVWNGGRGALNQHLFKVTSDTVSKWFYFFATRHHLQSFRAIAADKATTMGHIQRKHLTDARVAVASPEGMKKFDIAIAPLFDQLVSNAQQSRSLAQLRDTLLPKLISGELRVSDAERIVGAAV
jgi:type I restriction enzyme S subunit